MKLNDLVHRLRAAESLGDVARAVFADAVPALGAASAVIELHAADGRPFVWIASEPMDAIQARAYLRDGHRHDPCLAAVRDTHAAVTTDDFRVGHNPLAPAMHVVVGPVIGDGTLMGALRFVMTRPITTELRRAAGAVCTHVSVRLAELGFSAPPVAAFDGLTDRQRAIVDDVTRGRTTGEIAATLRISPNTVKKHLKAVFSRFGVANRVELAGLASRNGGGARRARITDLGGLHAISLRPGDDADLEPEPARVRAAGT